MNYDALRHFADSWGLVFMGVSYLILIGWHFLPRGRRHSQRAATMIFTETETEADHG
ncbi:MAG TPA: CcoQ/FixQ family Cbb3-type cytochrome c oxidase assembly chaperone [Sphingobium sp.]|jgi:cytochrome c oxidase cbb3-type subunit 4|uniref:cbb3-type cytochrome c oxidase subunit 3 n=1 Tax=unclassified Sphingobium TaxID=2611147 RepID=UPI0007F4866B|nr:MULTISPECIES: cbb3-type cytochrome c oxidase subunit 3 [unclassified Sphingobium]OAN52491.1 cytochrome C oxidase Cbb3 [Sphingobium sp. TCM1]WIW90799.1 cbb3-type cytochrome c oxidase subunit 3 [Sphingobium sp. V4]HAF41090.1 CcoQ/FixQ family Cbb3-type cytochrome c oxidase assembly chaperone [Sphingobium sp.]